MKYRVKVLGLQAKRKKPYKSQDIVDETAFEPGMIPKLLDGGYIVPLKEGSIKLEQVDEIPGKQGFDDITVKELKSYLDENQIEYNPIAKKSELYEIYSKG